MGSEQNEVQAEMVELQQTVDEARIYEVFRWGLAESAEVAQWVGQAERIESAGVGELELADWMSLVPVVQSIVTLKTH